MKKFSLLSLCCILAASMMFVGCASSSKKTDTTVEIEVPNAQPDWLYKSYSTDTLHFESGYGKMSNKQNSIKAAIADSKSKMASWINSSVVEVLQNYVNDAGSGDNRQAFDAFEVVGMQIAQATMVGLTTEDMWFDEDGSVWVLSSLPLYNLEKQFEPVAEAAAETFATNEAAEVANKKMKEAFARLLSMN